MDMVYFTICARNYLAYARTLGQSLRAQVPQSRFVVVLTDDLDGTDGFEEEVLPVDALNLPELSAMKARYTLLELATAVKPACYLHFLLKEGWRAAIYLDPDIEILAPLDEVTAALSSGASCVLTPHLLAPLTDNARPADLDILSSGTFNLGFAAFDNSAESLGYLSWWQSRLVKQGYNDLAHGLFVDQKWMEFAPSFLPNLKVLHHPGYNVAYWNLAHRPVTRAANGAWQAAGQPLVFFHFSGVMPGNPNIFSRHQDRFNVTAIGEAAKLLRGYLERLEANGHESWSRFPYAYSVFHDGTPIPDVVRRALGDETVPADWFDSLDSDYWDAPSDDVDPESGFTVTRLMAAIHNSRPDLRATFPLGTRSGRRAFHDWYIAHGARELRLGEAQIRAALKGKTTAFPGLARIISRLRLLLFRPVRR